MCGGRDESVRWMERLEERGVYIKDHPFHRQATTWLQPDALLRRW